MASAAAASGEEHAFFLNVTLISGEEMMRKKLHANSHKVGTHLRKGAAYTASKTLASPSHLAPKLAPKIAEDIPGKLGKQGITATAHPVLIQGPYFVIKVIIVDLELEAILKKLGAKKPSFRQFGSCFLSCMSKDVQHLVSRHVLARLVANNLATNMGKDVRELTLQQGIDLEAAGRVPETQTDYMLEKLSSGTVVMLK